MVKLDLHRQLSFLSPCHCSQVPDGGPGAPEAVLFLHIVQLIQSCPLSCQEANPPGDVEAECGEVEAPLVKFKPSVSCQAANPPGDLEAKGDEAEES